MRKLHNKHTHIRTQKSILIALMGLFLLCGTGTLRAAPVNEVTALSIAQKVLGTTDLVNQTSLLDPLLPNTTQGFLWLFVPESGVGFVVIPKYEHAPPVLAYSTTSIFPTNTNYTANGMLYALAIAGQRIKAATAAPSATLIAQWDQWRTARPPANRTAIEPLLTSQWGQQSYYAQQIPMLYKAGPGVSMAQLMRYWHCPSRGYGSNSYNHSIIGTVSADFDTTYAWGDMPDILDNNSTQAQRDAVSLLIYHAGVSISTNYGSTQANRNVAAYSSIRNAMVEHFGYDTCMHEVSISSTWDSILMKELHERRPFIIGIGSNGIGISVVDGCDSLGLFHVNWGNDGYGDGYFYLYNEPDPAFTVPFQALVKIIPENHVMILGVANEKTWGSVSCNNYTTYIGATAILTAQGAPGYRFDHWNDGGTDNPRYIVATENRTDTAYFVYAGYANVDVTANNPAWGSVDGGGTYLYSSTVTLHAYSTLMGYWFSHWDDGNTDNPRSIIVNGDCSYTAVFDYVGTATITTSANNADWGTVSGGGTYTLGVSLELFAQATDSCIFYGWSDGVTGNPRRVIVSGDHTYSAIFVPLKPVFLDDREPHSWSYYSDPDNPVRSLNPADVKISYFGYGENNMYSSNDATPTGIPDVDVKPNQVGIGIDAPFKNAFIYYKTLERHGGATAASKEDATGPCHYRTIPNPFSIRPTHGSGVTRWRGFYKWRVKRLVGGAIYANRSKTVPITQGSMVDADQELWIAPDAEYGMEIDFEAIWARAFVFAPTRPNGGINSVGLTPADYATGTNAYERNFVVITPINCHLIGTGTTTNLCCNKYPATITAVYPDGTDGTNAHRLDTIPDVALKQHFFSMSDTKFEYIWINAPTRTFLGNGYHFTMGRGIKNPEGGACLYCLGGNSPIEPVITSSTSNGVTIYTMTTREINTSTRSAHFRIESGSYGNILPAWCGVQTNRLDKRTYFTPSYMVSSSYDELAMWRIYSKTNANGQNSNFQTEITFGCDYDRSLGQNNLLEITNFIMGADNWSRGDMETDDFIWHVKSGEILPGHVYKGEAGIGNIYMGSVGAAEGSGFSTGRRKLDMEGGSVAGIAGGMNNIASTTDTNVWIRIRGGQVHGAIFAAGDYASGIGHRRIVITGGTVNGWVAGGANGNMDVNGKLDGDTYLYIGGTARIEPSADDPTINFSKGGNIFGAGSGNSAAAGQTATVGKVFNSTVVISDSCYIARDVYGGGNYGGVTKNGSRIYILGGTVAGKVFGGSNQQGGKAVDIVMRGGQVNGGVYGGSNLQGVVSGPVNINIEGGTVGYEGCDKDLGSVFGCGYGENTSVTGNVQVTVGKASAKFPHTDDPVIYHNVYGGGFNGSYNATGKTFQVTTYNGRIHGSIFGGGYGNTAVITGNTNVNILGTTYVGGNVYGGGNKGKVTGNTKVIIGD